MRPMGLVLQVNKLSHWPCFRSVKACPERSRRAGFDAPILLMPPSFLVVVYPFVNAFLAFGNLFGTHGLFDAFHVFE